MAQTVFCGIALEAHFLRGDQLHVVDILFLQSENGLDVLQIVPVRLHIKCPHKGEDHAVVVTFGELLEDHVAQPLDDVTPEGTEYLQHGLDHHVVVEQPQGCDLR